MTNQNQDVGVHCVSSGWRELGPDEKVQDGDEVANLGLNDWEPVANSVGSPVKHWSWLKFRRRVQPPTASAEPGRSLTVLEAILEARLESVLKANLGFRIPGSDSIRVNDVIADLQSQLAAERQRAEALLVECKKAHARIPGCSKPGCGYPDGKPCIGCGRVEYPHQAEENARLRSRVEQLESDLAIKEQAMAVMQKFSADIYHVTCLQHTDAERKWFSCPVCLRAKVEQLEKERDEARNDINRILIASGQDKPGCNADTVIYGIQHLRLLAESNLADGHRFNELQDERDRLKREVKELRKTMGLIADKCPHDPPSGGIGMLEDWSRSDLEYAVRFAGRNARALAERKEGQ